MIAQSQSGTGKTAAFVLTMLSRVVVENPWPQVCVHYSVSPLVLYGNYYHSGPCFVAHSAVQPGW